MSLIINPTDETKYYFAIADRMMVVKADDSQLCRGDIVAINTTCGCSCFVSEPDYAYSASTIIKIELLPSQYKLKPIRQSFHEFDSESQLTLSRAKAILSWYQHTSFCPNCGQALVDHPTFTARQCPSCHQIEFPRIAPCVIVLVRKDDKILLARHVERNQDIYACLAGFVEDGESLEQAVEREIYEETHINVKNITYFGSQSWPFPNQLMVGFTAEWESGDIKLQPEELSDARWFDPHQLPSIPAPGSLAYQLIASAQQKQE